MIYYELKTKPFLFVYFIIYFLGRFSLIRIIKIYVNKQTFVLIYKLVTTSRV